MPELDVSEALDEPLFQDHSLVVARSAETIGSNGVATVTTTETAFSGVVVQNSGDRLQRLADGTRHEDSITIYTRELLFARDQSRPADIVRWRGREWVVTVVMDWSTYGQGYFQVVCDKRSLA